MQQEQPQHTSKAKQTMSTAGENQESSAMAANKDEENDSDVELEGMDLEGDDGDADDVEMEEPASANAGADSQPEMETEATAKLATEDQDELEAAHRERKELMVAEQAALMNNDDSGSASMEQKLQYLISQSDVFAHFLAGSVAASEKKRGGSKKKGSRGKKNRMTEAEEDAQLLKTAESKRSVIRLNKQPSILASHCKMHGYQLEGLNWLIKLHCNGLNGILADEVSFQAAGILERTFLFLLSCFGL